MEEPFTKSKSATRSPLPYLWLSVSRKGERLKKFARRNSTTIWTTELLLRPLLFLLLLQIATSMLLCTSVLRREKQKSLLACEYFCSVGKPCWLYHFMTLWLSLSGASREPLICGPSPFSVHFRPQQGSPLLKYYVYCLYGKEVLYDWQNLAFWPCKKLSVSQAEKMRDRTKERKKWRETGEREREVCSVTKREREGKREKERQQCKKASARSET